MKTVMMDCKAEYAYRLTEHVACSFQFEACKTIVLLKHKALQQAVTSVSYV